MTYVLSLAFIMVQGMVIIGVSDFLLHALGIPVQLSLPGLLLFSPELL